MASAAENELDACLSKISAASADGYGIVLRRRKRPGDGWFPAVKLADEAPPALISRVQGLSGAGDHIRAEWMLESVARALADLGGSFLVSSHRLPDLGTQNVLLAAEGGLVRACGLLSARMSVLENDPAASLDGVEVSDGWQELADLFGEGFTGLLEPLIQWIDASGLRPAKTLWQASADRLAQSLDWCGTAFDDRDLSRQLATRVLNTDSRLSIPLECGVDDFGNDFHLRTTCCLAYRTPGAGYCRSCPLNR